VDETRLLRMILVRLDWGSFFACRSCREVRDCQTAMLLFSHGSDWITGPFRLSSRCLPMSRPSARSNHQSSWYMQGSKGVENSLRIRLACSSQCLVAA
jgi:hypothetical protein